MVGHPNGYGNLTKQYLTVIVIVEYNNNEAHFFNYCHNNLYLDFKPINPYCQTLLSPYNFFRRTAYIKLHQKAITVIISGLELSLALKNTKGSVFNAFHAAGECRRQVKKLTKFVKNVEIVEFHDHI